MKQVKLKRCTRCIMPETQQDITFDSKGVCGVCRNSEVKKRIDWKKKKEELIKLIDKYRGKYAYDCIIPFSGGKDSTFTVYELVKKYKVKPLLVSFDHGFLRPRMERNRVKVVKKLGVDIITFRPSWKVVKKLMGEAYIKTGDFCWFCHTGVYAYPMQIAVKFNVPLIFWGEPNAEYVSTYSYDKQEEVDEERFKGATLGLTANDMYEALKGKLSKRDLQPFTYPESKDLKKLKVRSVCLGSYIPWDGRKAAQVIKKELNWEFDRVEGIPPMYGYPKIECCLYGVRDYLLYIKKGFGRTAHLTSMDIRAGIMSRIKALQLAGRYDGKRPVSMDWFLKQIGFTEKKFMKIAYQHVAKPWVFNSNRVKRGKKLWDQDLWDRTE